MNIHGGTIVAKIAQTGGFGIRFYLGKEQRIELLVRIRYFMIFYIYLHGKIYFTVQMEEFKLYYWTNKFNYIGANDYYTSAGCHIFPDYCLRFSTAQALDAIKLSVQGQGFGGWCKSDLVLWPLPQQQSGRVTLSAWLRLLSMGRSGCGAMGVGYGGLGYFYQIYMEGLLAIKYRKQTADGKMLGGPMFALEKAEDEMACHLVCISTAVAAFGTGSHGTG